MTQKTIAGRKLSPKAKKRKAAKKSRSLLNSLWPEVSDNDLWIRTQRTGFTTIPRTMPLIMQIIDDLTKGQPASMTYFELWSRVHDDCYVILSKPREISFLAGHSGQRAESTWRKRMLSLASFGFIDIKPGPSGAISYALIYNPYHVIKRLYAERTPGITAEKYNALLARAVEIGADDLDEDAV